LEKIVKSFNYVSLIKVESCREDFTRHGLHLNRSGKLLVSKQIAKCVNTLFKKETFEPIKLGWKCNPDICTNDNVGKLDIAANDNAITNVQKDREQASSSVRMAT
jgi:hypothetical protein